MTQFNLPPVIAKLVAARKELSHHYESYRLSFTFDGKLVGDIGEAIAADLFGVKLEGRNGTGIDGRAADGRTVQVKATGTRRGPVFRNIELRADHLLFFDINFDTLKGRVIFNGPERVALRSMPAQWSGQRMISRRQIELANDDVRPEDRLPRV